MTEAEWLACGLSASNKDLAESHTVKVKVLLVVAVFLGCGSITLYCQWSDWSPAAKRASVKRGDRVIAALRAYHSDHGCFPESLDGLTPKYLPEVPPPLAGTRRWRYWVEPDKQTFLLQFSARGGTPSVNYCSSPVWERVGWYGDDDG